MDLYKGVPKKLIWLDVISVIAWAAFNCVFAEMLARLTQDITADYTKLLNVGLTFVLFIVGWEIIEYVGDYVLNLVDSHIENNIDKEYLSMVASLRPEVIKKYNTGYICGLTSKYMRTKVKAYENIVQMGIISGGYVMYCIIRMFTLSIFYGMIAVVLVGLGVGIRCYANSKLVKYIDAISDIESDRVKLFNDSIGNVTTLQKMRSTAFVQERMNGICATVIERVKEWARIDETAFVTFKFLMYMFAPACILVTVFLRLDEVIDMSIALPLISVMELQLIHNTKHIATSIKCLNEYIVVKHKMDKLVDEDNKAIMSYVEDFNTIDITNVAYRYENEDKSVLVQIPSFGVTRGDKICVYGESGQGKTTTLNILSGEIETDAVVVDGRRLNNERLDCVFIAQDTEMLDMTIRDNLCVGRNIPESELLSLIDAVGLTDWLNKQKDGLDTFIGERGVFLSTGQRQRLNLVRGLLINKELYLLDEPTSNVDDETEQKIIKLLDERLKDKTVVIVSHRPAIKAICNKEYKFKNGVCKLVKL